MVNSHKKITEQQPGKVTDAGFKGMGTFRWVVGIIGGEKNRVNL